MQEKTSAGPLAGIKVLELGTLIAGPFCARMLAEFGADVIKIESPDGGDPIRTWRVLKDGTSLWWSVQARNKKSLTLNLKVAGRPRHRAPAGPGSGHHHRELPPRRAGKVGPRL